ncbi:MAG: hypothetical protein JWO87_3046 [Phycisphaerales bacterium]|nr:hypothetical protein [Phycisphaerales bacterium]
MPLLENQLARRDKDALELRPEPLRLRWEFNDLVAADGHELRAVFSGSVRAVPDRTERRMLQEVLLDGRSAVSGDDVVAHFSSALRASAARVAQIHSAADWLGNDAAKGELIDALKTSARAVAFACGVEVLPPFQAELQSPTFERQRVRAMQQALAEKEAAGQVEHFQRAAELLKQFQGIRGSAPEISPGRVLQQMNPADQGAMLQSLLMAAANEQAAQKLWAVAGPYLIRVDARGTDGRVAPKPELFPLPPTLGPLRSVQAADVDGRRVLLVGARSGFLLVHPDAPAEARAYHDQGVNSPNGFNRVAWWPKRRQFLATHSEGGLVAWDIDSPDAPAKVVRLDALGAGPAQPTIPSGTGSIRSTGQPGPRNLQFLDDSTLIFSVGNRLHFWDGASASALAPDSDAEIVAIVPDDRQVFAVHEDGMISAIERASKQKLSAQRRAGRVQSAGTLPWLGSARLLIAGDQGPVQCIGLDDPLVTQYASPYRGLRVITGSADLVAGVSPDRQRLVLWNSWDGRQAAAELYVVALTRHRIADVAFG